VGRDCLLRGLRWSAVSRRCHRSGRNLQPVAVAMYRHNRHTRYLCPTRRDTAAVRRLHVEGPTTAWISSAKSPSEVRAVVRRGPRGNERSTRRGVGIRLSRPRRKAPSSTTRRERCSREEGRFCSLSTRRTARPGPPSVVQPAHHGVYRIKAAIPDAIRLLASWNAGSGLKHETSGGRATNYATHPQSVRARQDDRFVPNARPGWAGVRWGCCLCWSSSGTRSTRRTANAALACELRTRS